MSASYIDRVLALENWLGPSAACMRADESQFFFQTEGLGECPQVC